MLLGQAFYTASSLQWAVEATTRDLMIDRHLTEAEFEQPVAASRLDIVVALRRRAGEDLDLPVVEAKAPINHANLRLEGAFVRQKYPRRATFDNRRGDVRSIDV